MKTKTLCLIGAFLLICTSNNSFAMGEDVAKEAIREVGQTARAAINKNKSEVKIKDSTLKNDVEMEEAVSVGNSGISVKADKVEISNSELDNKVKMKRAISVGNSGIEVGK